MDLLDIRTFMCIVEKKSISAAARSMFISQPAISARLDHLEAELNTRLILRGKGRRSIQLTSAGQTFLPIAEKWIEADRQTELFKTQCGQVSLRLVSTSSVHEYIAPNIIRKLMKSENNLRVQLESANVEDLTSFIMHSRADVGFHVKSDESQKHLVTIPLFEEEKYLLLPSNTCLPETPIHPSQLDPAYEVTITSVSDRTRRWHNEWFSPLIEPFAKVDSNHLAYHYLTDPKCWTICAASVVMSLVKTHPELVFRKIDPPPPNRIIYIVRPREISFYLFDLIQKLEQSTYEYAQEMPWLHAYPPENIKR